MGDENHDQNKHSNNKHENGTIMLATHGSSNHGDVVRRIHSNDCRRLLVSGRPWHGKVRRRTLLSTVPDIPKKQLPVY